MKRSFFERDAPQVALGLLGATFSTADGISVRIVETEAYTGDDPASHSHRGPTRRNAVMFGPPGHLYVYFTYGMHWCANIVTGPTGEGQAVLLRAATILRGSDLIRTRRGPKVSAGNLTNGPAKLCQALDIGGVDNGTDLFTNGRFELSEPDQIPEFQATRRIGISKGIERLWRFVVV